MTHLQHLLYCRGLELNPQYLQDVCLHRVLNICLVWQAFWTFHKFKIHGSSVPGDSPGKNTGVLCYALLQGVFPSQGLNLGLLRCRWFIIWATREALHKCTHGIFCECFCSKMFVRFIHVTSWEYTSLIFMVVWNSLISTRGVSYPLSWWSFAFFSVWGYDEQGGNEHPYTSIPVYMCTTFLNTTESKDYTHFQHHQIMTILWKISCANSHFHHQSSGSSTS